MKFQQIEIMTKNQMETLGLKKYSMWKKTKTQPNSKLEMIGYQWLEDSNRAMEIIQFKKQGKREWRSEKVSVTCRTISKALIYM